MFYCSLLAGVVLALLPWLRNRHYLRDLYDYGLVLAANGHLDRGEYPYVDFTTPIQAGFLGLNWLVERLLGATYGGLTMGAAGLIAGSMVLLVLILAKRWPRWLALLTGGAITIASASQHTILWHNAIGVFCMAVAVWTAAIAPIWQRATWRWHLLTALGLLFGGVNKINFQLVALCAAFAWVIQARLLDRASGKSCACTLLGIFLVGCVAPIAWECWWTGASFQQWWNNVILLPAGQRLGILDQIVTRDFLFRSTHDYYGPSMFSQIGLFGLGMTLVAFTGLVWLHRDTHRRGLMAALSALTAGMAGAVLLQSNFEISHVGLSAWLALMVGVWLAQTKQAMVGKWLVFGVASPAVLLAIASWSSAWEGQRSQFGYSDAARSEYQEVSSVTSAMPQLEGLRLPSELVNSVKVFETNLPEPDSAGRYFVFYGLGTEWLDRFYPARRERGDPLWVHWGTSYDHAAIARLRAELERQYEYDAVYCTVARRNEWPEDIGLVLRENYERKFIGSAMLGYTPRNSGAPDLSDGFDTLAKMGGNVIGAFFHFERSPLVFRSNADGNVVLGTQRSSGSVLLNTPTYRVQGVARFDRLPRADASPVKTLAKITVHGSIPEQLLWSDRLELSEGQQSVSVPFSVDPGGRRIVLWIAQEGSIESAGFAGFRELEIHAAVEGPDMAPALRPNTLPARRARAEETETLFRLNSWRPQSTYVRGAELVNDRMILMPGGELWFHTPNMTGTIEGRITKGTGNTASPMVRIVWYKGGRLQLVQSGVVPDHDAYSFRVWTAEPGGWIGILTDKGDAAPVGVDLTAVNMQP